MNIIEERYDWAYPLTRRARTTLLVLHHEGGSGSTAQDIHRFHRYTRGWAGIAYHYYIRKDGSIYRGRPESMIGGHCLGYNSESIGICFEGNFESDQMLTAQLNAGWELIADIVRRYPCISVRRHKDLNQTACPGRNFPFAALTGAENPKGEEEMTQEEFNRMAAAWETTKGQTKANDEGMAAMAKAASKGIMDGSRPNSPLTRAEYAITLNRRHALD